MVLPKRFDASDAASVLGEWADTFDTKSQSTVFNELADPLNEGIAMNFAHKQEPNGEWKPHAKRTIQMHGPHPLLVLSGDMYRSVTQRGSPFRIEEVTDKGLAVGSNVSYAKYQEFGTSKIPSRRFMWLHSEDKEAIHKRYADLVFTLLIDGES